MLGGKQDSTPRVCAFRVCVLLRSFVWRECTCVQRLDLWAPLIGRLARGKTESSREPNLKSPLVFLL